MRKFTKESTAPTEGVTRVSGGWLQNHGVLVVCLVAVLALVLRTVFAFGISADNDFALSGGSEAQYHLHVVESILDGSFIIGSDAAINYPVGGLNTNAPLYDFLAAAIGSFAGASTALAVLAPIFGALICFPVYFIGKELYGTKAGVLAALIIGLMALPIVSTVFSNGTEYAFVAFLTAFLIWALIKVSKKVSSGELAIKEALIAGVLFGLIALSWNDFRSILVLMVIVMVIQMVLDRFNSKDFSPTLYTYSIIMVVGLAIGAAYYIPANLWDAVFSGPVLIAVITIAFGFIFKGLQNSPWIFTIPGLIIAFVAIAVVLFFVAPDYFTALIFGNSTYTNSIMTELINNHISISRMSSYYGWVLMWMPAVLGLWELYTYAKKDRSHTQLFVTMTFLILWMFSWTSYSCAAVLGPIFAISSAVIIIRVLQKADLKSYWTSMKAAGFPGCFRKMIKPLPFVSVLVAVFLIAVPGVAYAVDAGIPSNSDSGYMFYGNTAFTIAEGEHSPVTMIYDDIEDKDSAVVSWIDYAPGFEAKGFDTVNDLKGDGASVAAQIFLAEGASGATAAQIVRIVESTDKDLASCFTDSSLYYMIVKFLKDPAFAKETVLSDSTTYGALTSDITDQNASYIASIKEITKRLTATEISNTYAKVKGSTGYSIGHYVLDGSMLPIIYGDGSSLSTMAYFAGYNVDGYGAPTQFYSYITYYSNYYPATATDALYQTFLWKAIVGPAPSDMGYTSSFSFLNDLSLSNGKVKAMPGYGLAGYEIESWYVKYNGNPRATSTDSGWEYMSYDDAIALQQKDGGVINYLSSIIAYEYVGASASTVSGSVVDENGNGIEGITVSVSYYDERYGADTVYAETKTDVNGEYTIFSLPNNPYFTFKNGNVKLETTGEYDVVFQSSNFKGRVALGDNICTDPDYMYVLKSDLRTYYIQTDNGYINSLDAVDERGESVSIVPGLYTYELRDASGTAVSSGSVTFYTGENNGLVVSPTSYTITASVTDFHGQTLNDEATVVATNTSTGIEYSKDLLDGKAVITVPSGTYTLSMTGGYMTDYSSSLTVTSNRNVTLKAYEADAITINGYEGGIISVYGGSFSFTVEGSEAYVPTSIGETLTGLTFYGVTGSKVYMGYYSSGSSVELHSGAICTVKGSIGSAGSISFVDSTGAIINAAADSEGKFSVPLYAGTFTVFANNGSDKVYVDTVSVSGDKDMGTLSLVDGRKVTVTYQYESNTSRSSVALPFALAEIKYKVNSADHIQTSMTDKDGKASFYIPDNATDISVVINGGSINNDEFSYSELTASVDAGTSDSSKSIVISKSGVKSQSVTADYDMKLTPYGDGEEIELKKGETKTLASGQYTVTINANTGYYFDGDAYIYPGQGYFTALNPIEVYGVEIIKNEKDKLTITGDLTYDNYNGDNVYYFEPGCIYYIKSENTEGEKKLVKNATVSGPTVTKLDMTAVDELMKITGYVGAIADGTATITYDDAEIEADIKSGEFEVDIPSSVKSAKFEVSVTSTVSSQKYGFYATKEVSGLTDGMIVNIPVESEIGVAEYDDDLDGYIFDATFDAGEFSALVEVFNNTDSDKTYAITAGSAWNLNESTQVFVEANSSATQRIEGTYEPNGVGIGTQGMSVIISDFNGTAKKTIPVVDGDIVTSQSIVTMKTAADSNNKDRLSGNEYQYALTFFNTGGMNEVTINATVASGYSLSLMNADGSVIRSNGGTFVVAPQTSTVIYVKVMSETGELTTVPSISVDAGSAGSAASLTPSSMSITVDSIDVSGDSAVSKLSGVPTGIWFLFGLSIILLILIVWMGSKRGVFSRR